MPGICLTPSAEIPAQTLERQFSDRCSPSRSYSTSKWSLFSDGSTSYEAGFVKPNLLSPRRPRISLYLRRLAYKVPPATRVPPSGKFHLALQSPRQKVLLPRGRCGDSASSCYNPDTIAEDRATRGRDPSAVTVTIRSGRALFARPVLFSLTGGRQCDKSWGASPKPLRSI
jgi:hypothetical protein